MQFIERLFLVGAVLLLVAMAAITFVDVIGRYVFNRPLGGAFELIAIGMALMIFAALPWATAENKHVSVSFVKFLPEGIRTVLRGVMSAVTAISLCILGWRLFEHALRLASYGDYAMFTRIPYAPIAFFMALAAGLAGVFFAVRILINPRQPLPEDSESQL